MKTAFPHAEAPRSTGTCICPWCKIRLYLPFTQAQLDYLIYITEENINHTLSRLFHNKVGDQGQWIVSTLEEMKEGTVEPGPSYEDQGEDKASFIPLECTSCGNMLCFPLDHYDMKFLLNLSQRPSTPSYLLPREKYLIENKLGSLTIVIAEHDCQQAGCFQDTPLKKEVLTLSLPLQKEKATVGLHKPTRSRW